MAKLVEYITPTWIPEKEGECIPIYDSSIDGERIELVRCKDCKWADPRDGVCEHLPGAIASPDWFCADGERR